MVGREAITVIDLFAGPGGLGEGFSAFRRGRNNSPPFQIQLSAEMDPVASKTLRLRSFYRKALANGSVPRSYYQYLAGSSEKPFSRLTEELWEAATAEVRCLTLGSEEGNSAIDASLPGLVSRDTPWVLIGGPPCQAYSLAGRVRNKVVEGYVPEEDSRHFLYREYLRIIADHKPTIFVMENVKGILSSKISGDHIFHYILEDLADPEKAACRRKGKGRSKYRLYSLTSGECFQSGDRVQDFDSRRFVVRSEDFGVPQKRHRVFVVGVREDIDIKMPVLAPTLPLTSCKSAIDDLPSLRSGLSKSEDNLSEWLAAVRGEGEKLASVTSNSELSKVSEVVQSSLDKFASGGVSFARRTVDKRVVAEANLKIPSILREWYLDARLEFPPNHETRGHIVPDLGRYLFCASYGKVFDNSPKSKDFPDYLAPDHKNWSTGKFADRFRVQLANHPATTVTSHISKDGHYFIHYDPEQCRSLTVREAARLQTFPDNYFFEGNRTQQYVQVGNAVPPYLAKQIAEIVWEILRAWKK